MSTSPVPVKTNTAGNGAIASRYSTSPFLQIRREFDQLFNRFFGYVPTLWSDVDQEMSWGGVDMQDKDDSVLVRFEVPGFDAKEIDLKLTGNDLVLRAEHKSEIKNKDREESSESSIYRSVTLPQGVLTEKAEAKYANGLLNVMIPKGESSKGRKIAIQSA